MKSIKDFLLESENEIISADELIKKIIKSWGGSKNKDLIKGYDDKVKQFISGFGNKFKSVTNDSITNKLEEIWMDEGGGSGENGIDLRKEDVGQGVLLNIELKSKQYVGNCYGYYGINWYQIL